MSRTIPWLSFRGGFRVASLDTSFTKLILLLVLIHISTTNAAGPEIGLGRTGGQDEPAELTRRAMPLSSSLDDNLQDGSPSPFNLFGRATDDDHTCAEGRPCKNGACCGISGVCGYGPSYCGFGCSSNCDAKAECGQYSADGETTCPLNVCCSQYGFCGSTEEFCDPGSGCQSNCGIPKSPGSGGNVRSQVIGYYESWRADSESCGTLKPSQIPASALDILNFAFAYISPETLDIVPMVGDDGSSLSNEDAGALYHKVTAAKMRNSKLGVWLAIGGWTFSDNGTQFQPVFGDIAANSIARSTFARNLAQFMLEYGFDGVDIDWEYPGAPDRGGSDRDIDNFPLMLAAIREAFNSYGKGKWGISITTPSSYWYLRWFDLPAIAEHVNFINLMSYDLHGIWDKTNEIGQQILAHTNLTEVDKALELFWRNDISPSLINLGIAFYGRSYTLADASCYTPGCAFASAGSKGECTKTAGYLSYREIMDKVSDAGGAVNEVWDEVAGVKMLVYDSNHWISYDDSATFQQKVDFANERGLAGLMVWAIDQDDDGFNALKALTHKDIDPQFDEDSLIDDFDISKCEYMDCNDECLSGWKEMTRLNLDQDGQGCKGAGKNSKQRPFCCQPWGAPDPETCHWTKCGQACGEGEITLALDDYGGGGHCNVNRKSFCCPASAAQKSVEACEWKGGTTCPSDKPQKLTYSGVSSLCCPEKPKFKSCKWQGTPGFCNQANCPVDQITVAQSSWSTPGNSNGCWFGGKKSFCCDSPVGGASGGTLPVGLDRLFPEYDEIPSEDEPTWAEAQESSSEEGEVAGNLLDPNENSFAWVVMVGPPDSVQSLDRRDGSFLETFNCPDPAPSDYNTQTFHAVCMADSENHDCEDLLLGGGAYGTLARLPEDCGPDEWVRVVSFQQTNSLGVPPHLAKRMTNFSNVYEIKYDYKIRDIANDEILVRIDSSSHKNYWHDVVASEIEKRDVVDSRNDTLGLPVLDWREPHYDWFRRHEARLQQDQQINEKRGAGSLSWWKKLFDGFIAGGTTLAGQGVNYRFEQTLYEATVSCPPTFDASIKVDAVGGLVADLDWGVSLIGKVKDTEFEQAYAFFRLNSLDVNAQLGIKGSAQFTLESPEAQLLSNFAPWGGSFNIKGLVTIGPFMDVTAQIDSIATISGDFSTAVTMSGPEDGHPLAWGYPSGVSDGPDDKSVSSHIYAADTLMEPSYEVSVAAQGSVSLTLTPSVAFKIQVDINGILETDTHIRAAMPNRMVLGVGTDDDCKGLMYEVSYEQKFDIITNAPILGWEKKTQNVYQHAVSLLPPKCYAFSADENKRGSEHLRLHPRDDDDEDEPIVGPLFPDPKGRAVVCARDTFLETGACGNIFDSDGNEIDPECNDSNSGSTASSVAEPRSLSYLAPRDTAIKLRPEYINHQRWFERRSMIEKRFSSKARFNLCTTSRPAKPVITVDGLSFPSSGDLVREIANGDFFTTYAPHDKTDMLDYEFGVQSTPDSDETAQYNAEHVLEFQTIQRFLEAYTTRMQARSVTFPNRASTEFQDTKKFVKDSWIKSQQWDFCMHIKFWLDTIPLQADWYDGQVYPTSSGGKGPLGATIMKTLPHRNKYYHEMTILDLDTNSVKEAAWNDVVQDVRTVGACIAKDNYAKALCAMRKVLFTIRYLQLVQDTLITQVNRVVDYLDAMEDAAAAFDDDDYVSGGYTRLGISRYWKKWMYDHSAVTGIKLAGLLNENLEDLQEKVENIQNSNGGAAGGGTTTGAGQLNPEIQTQLTALENAYASIGQWSYDDWANPFLQWANEPNL
ncbi:putative chitinase [Seiridium cardinale]